MENNERNLGEDQKVINKFQLKLLIDFNKCNHCGACTKVCLQEVLVMENNKLQVVNSERCTHCAACLKRCLKRAISINE